MKGDALEGSWSLKVHANSLPLLVSSLILREYGCGQIDVSCILNDTVYCFEVKSSGYVSRKQLSRLRKSSELLGIVLDRNSFIRIVK